MGDLRLSHQPPFCGRRDTVVGVSMETLCQELRERLATVRAGGGAKAVERHRSRGKLTARERVDLLVDPESAFLELSPLAAWDCYEGASPGAGIVTGIGQVHGRECMLIANDATADRKSVV